MNCIACEARLHDFVDGELAESEARAIAGHLAHCASCRQKAEALQMLLRHAAELGKEIPPHRELWPAIANKLERSSAPEARPASHRVIAFFPWLATAAAIAFLATVAERNVGTRAYLPSWGISSLAGAPRVNDRAFSGDTRFRLGQWLETDATASAKIAVGSVGEVTVEPNSRLRLTGTTPGDHRLELARGSLRAFIWAPPRIFYVDTPSATAVDLGCAYTLSVDEEGNGELRVTSGYVALKHASRESIIPAGAVCLTRRGAGPGTPFAGDAPEELRQALVRFDYEPGAAGTVLPTILANVRQEDAVTLWHLLARTEGAAREDVFEALARFRPPPEGVTRAGVLGGDETMRQAWAAALGLGSFFAVQ